MKKHFENFDELVTACKRGDLDSLENDSGGFNFSSLPAWGSAPQGTDSVWSWDETRALVGEGKPSTWVVVSRLPNGEVWE